MQATTFCKFFLGEAQIFSKLTNVSSKLFGKNLIIHDANYVNLHSMSLQTMGSIDGAYHEGFVDHPNLVRAASTTDPRSTDDRESLKTSEFASPSFVTY